MSPTPAATARSSDRATPSEQRATLQEGQQLTEITDNSEFAPVSSASRRPTLLTVIGAAFFALYTWMFIGSVSKWWFNKGWTTDDAVQQVFPFHEVHHPGIFAGDLITEVMNGYLAPVHYWLCFGVTMLVGDPIMMAHWVMLIQVVISVGFIFLAVRSAAGTAPAFFAAAWLLHTRHVMQRLTGGLPRGWAACIFAAFLYFAISKNHKGVLCTILIGCLLSPPSAFLVAVGYGLILCAGLFQKETRKEYRKKLISYAIFAPFCAVITMAVVHRPPQVGQMVNLKEASAMPEFQRASGDRPNGRFPFLPLRDPWDEMKIFGFQAFVNRFWTPPPFVKTYMPTIVLAILGGLLVSCVVRRREVIPREVVLYGVGTLIVYFASRALAFKLYVPDRHIQFPFAFFFISAFTIGIWRLLHLGKSSQVRDTGIRKAWLSAIGVVGLGSFIYWGSAEGLQGSANFNYAVDRKGEVFNWLKQNTAENSLIAGHPTHVDGTQLFAIRRSYVSTETTHPFYTRYYAEMKRRTEIVLSAHYSTSPQGFLALIEPEGIDFFIFKRSEFTPDALSKATYFSPLDLLVRKLTRRSPGEYLYTSLAQTDATTTSYIPFRDKQSLVVDIKKLREYVDSQSRM